jgi:predicted nuclease of predicted toxin-antitoxin system
VILRCYCENADLIIKLTSQVVNKKVITNDDKMYDLINYAIGTIKCFTQTSKEVQRNTVQNQMIAVLSKALQRTFTFGTN